MIFAEVPEPWEEGCDPVVGGHLGGLRQPTRACRGFDRFDHDRAFSFPERTWKAASMDPEAAQRSANRVGLVTLPLGLALVAAPARAGRFLRVGKHPAALRVIGLLDLALVPGLLLDGGKWQWLTARAGLNIGIAAYCLRLVRREQAPGAVVAVAGMLAATVADTRAITALHRSGKR